jgi:hypothetical protein
MMSEQFENKQYDPAQFDAKQFPGGGIEPLSSTCDGTYYADRADIELLFGKTNVEKWADVDNNQNQDDIGTRICWALQNAKAYFDDSLYRGPLVIPFVAPYPNQVRVENARYAGCTLYDSRGVVDMVDGKAHDALEAHRKKVQTFITRILANQLTLVGVEMRTNTPGVPIDEEIVYPLPYPYDLYQISLPQRKVWY